MARLGGDEFTVILEDLADARSAAAVAQKLHDAIAAPVRIENHDVFVNTSVFEGEVGAPEARVHRVAATEIATGLGSPLSATMVMSASESLAGSDFMRGHLRRHAAQLRRICSRHPRR